MKRIGMMLTLAFAVILSACDAAPTAPVVTQQTAQVALPPFTTSSAPIYVPINSGPFSISLLFYAPENFVPKLDVVVTDTSIAKVANWSTTRTQYTGDARAIWTVTISFWVIKADTAKITLKLLNVPGQSSSFSVVGYDTGAKG